MNNVCGLRLIYGLSGGSRAQNLGWAQMQEGGGVLSRDNKLGTPRVDAAYTCAPLGVYQGYLSVLSGMLLKACTLQLPNPYSLSLSGLPISTY